MPAKSLENNGSRREARFLLSACGTGTFVVGRGDYRSLPAIKAAFRNRISGIAALNVAVSVG
jgi:hypothetical protein